MGLLSKVVEHFVLPVAVRTRVARERRESGVSYDLTSDQVRADPYATYRQLRSTDPVHRMRLVDAWALSRYQDVEAVLRDHKRFANAGRILVETIPLSLLDIDPPAHTRLRLLVSKAFTPRAIARLHTRIQEITDGLLDAVADREQFDLIAALGYPLPITIIAEMLGVRPRDMDRFAQWSHALALSVDPILGRDQIQAIKRAEQEAFAYFETIIADHRRQPRDDLVSALLAAEEAGDRLTHAELLSIMLLLLVAGNETTRNLIGNGMLALLRNPDQLQRLRDHPDLLDSAVDELLRYDSPVQLNGRSALQDVELGGKLLPRFHRYPARATLAHLWPRAGSSFPRRLESPVAGSSQPPTRPLQATPATDLLQLRRKKEARVHAPRSRECEIRCRIPVSARAGER